MIISIIGRRGQMTVPREIRRSLNLREGDRVAFIRRGDEVVLQPLTNTLLDLRGSVPVTEAQDFDAIRNQVDPEACPAGGLGWRLKRFFADTNLFLRYLTNDVAAQADAVEQLLHRASRGEVVLVINNMVVAEIVWTLESYYGLARDNVKDKILAILNTPGLEAADGDMLLQAISWYADKNVDFIDAFNAVWLLAHGVTVVSTFDHKHFSRFEGIRIQVPGR